MYEESVKYYIESDYSSDKCYSWITWNINCIFVNM
ncbi:hypothetical protein SAMN05444349_101121 [Bacteroides faecichinchillae]|uniref:Uncharacterized protein n=1 Tax=Bacteroides faecichinchillae TaxID=871325 RepID=A0A1M4SG62_9BACE|nr:hypothetical protein SAMN05444349_101121 [Bacteroides faecichinchillae]